MKNFIYKFRYFILILFCTLIFFIPNNNVYAAQTIDDVVEKLENTDLLERLEGRPYFVAKNPNDEYFKLYAPCFNHCNGWDFANDEIYFYIDPSVLGPYRLSVRNETKGESLSHYLVCTLNTSDSYSMNSYCNTNTYNSFIDYYNNGGSIYTTIPIYSDINKTEVFFFNQFPLKYQIPTIAEVEEIPQVMTGVLKILIPVGLVLLSIFLVIYLVRLVISRVV